jgi:hypothetical protein
MEVLTMFGKNRKKTVGLCVMVVTASLVMAGLWAVLATPETALADHKGKPHGKPGGDGGGENSAIHGCVELRDDTDDRVQSDTRGEYCDGEDSTIVGLLEFFRFKMKVKNNGVGRRLFLNFANFTDQDAVNACLPADQNVWILGVDGTLAEWRAQDLNAGVLRDGNLHFGKTGKDEANVSFGRFGRGDDLTVTRTDVDVWTIESLAGNTAVLWRDLVDGTAVPCASGSMPFKVTYDGTR